MVYLMRHAETDWRQVNGRGWVGLANDFAPLTARGRRQAAEAASRVAHLEPAVLLTSPMTRALETAAILGRRLGLDPVVQLDLREWLPDRGLRWSSPAQVQDAYAAMIEGATAGAAGRMGLSRWQCNPIGARMALASPAPAM